MHLKFDSARKTEKGHILVLVEMSDNIGIRSQEFLYKDMSWWKYPQGVYVSATPDGSEIVEKLDLIKDEHIDGKKISKMYTPSIPTEEKDEDIYDPKTIEGKPFVFVSCSAGKPKEHPIDPALWHLNSINTTYKGATKNVPIERVWNNTKGLSEVYNSFITEKYKDHIMVFVHDDVYLDDRLVLEKLHAAHEVYDIVGLAGCKDPVVKSPPLWHVMAPKENLRGFVSHELPQGISMANFGPTRTSVDLIDGLFMSVDVSKLLESGVRFDEEFTFHFYDLAFCLRAKEHTIGVWDIFVRHEGTGQPDATWHSLQERFIEKYK